MQNVSLRSPPFVSSDVSRLSAGNHPTAIFTGFVPVRCAGCCRRLHSTAPCRSPLRFALDRYGFDAIVKRSRLPCSAFSGWPPANRLLFAPDLHARRGLAARCSNSAYTTVIQCPAVLRHFERFVGTPTQVSPPSNTNHFDNIATAALESRFLTCRINQRDLTDLTLYSSFLFACPFTLSPKRFCLSTTLTHCRLLMVKPNPKT